MKKLCSIMLAVLVFCTASFADETKLLDISAFTGTSLDLSEEAKELGYTTEEQLALVSNLTLAGEWDVEFNTSSSNPYTKANSRAVYVAGVSKTFGDMIVLNAILPNHASTITVKPIFPVELNKPNLGLGYISNIADIKMIKADFSGINRDDDVFIIFRDKFGNKTELKMTKGEQRINGAESCIWENSNYIQNPRKRELEDVQTWPNATTEMIFEGFKIRSVNGGDVAFAFGNVTVIYDKAFLEQERDINFEEVFGLDNSAEHKARLNATKKIIERELGVFVESEKMHKETVESTPEVSEK